MNLDELGEALRPWQYDAMEEYNKARIEALQAHMEELTDTVKTSQRIMKKVYLALCMSKCDSTDIYAELTNIQLLLDKYDTLLNNE